jgi:hypothetical protein
MKLSKNYMAPEKENSDPFMHGRVIEIQVKRGFHFN